MAAAPEFELSYLLFPGLFENGRDEVSASDSKRAGENQHQRVAGCGF